MGNLSRKALALLALAAGLLGGLVLSGAEPPVAVSDRGPAMAERPEAKPVRVIVRFRPGADAADRATARRAAGAEYDEALPVARMQLVDPKPGVSVGSAVERLERSPAVAYAEPDAPRSALVRPNDTYFDFLWGLHNTGQAVAGSTGTADADVDAAEAWDVTTGAAGVTVAVVDSGVDAGHPDLAPNLVEGRDWVDADSDPADANGHGTHVAGTIGARGNDGGGVAGVAWQVSLAPLRVLDAEGSGYVSDVIEAYAYARDRKLRVVNASLGGDSYSQAERDAIASAPETLFVVAAGNDGADNDVTSSFPCNFDLANLICVAAVDQDDTLADFSNRGAATVDLAAPGVNVASTWPGGEWAIVDGTSMATPHVAGAAALVWSVAPGATVTEVRQALLGSVDPKASLLGVTATGGRLNVDAAVRAASAITSDGGEAPASPGPARDEEAAPPADSAPSLTQQPAPTPAPAQGSSPDVTPPSLRVTTASRRRIRAVLRRGLRARVSCSEACTLRAELRLSALTARRLGIKRAPPVAGRARGGIARTGSTLLVVRPTATVRRRLSRLRTVRLQLVVRATDRSGNRRRAVRRVLLTR